MPARKRYKTKYPGVFYINGTSLNGKSERIYYIRYRRNGKLVEEKSGRQFQDDMTAARAAQVRTKRIEGSQLSNKEARKAERAKREAEANRWTIGRLAGEYFKGRSEGKSRNVDKNRYENYLKPDFGNKEPQDILPLDVDRIRINLLKKLSPQTVKHILNLLTWIINFGTKKNLCSPLPFHIQKPTVNNKVTEDLTDQQLRRLLEAIEADSNIQIKNLMKMALFTGMRAGELFNLKWEDIDFDRFFIRINDPKSGIDQHIPLNKDARQVLESHPREDSAYVFPGQGGNKRTTARVGVNRIKARARLPKNFRPLHGLRHVYASTLASSGKVGMYTLQRLLTHKDPRMTQRYAHLRDEALKDASNLAGVLIANAANGSKSN